MAKFDGLATLYDKTRPRYPIQLFEPSLKGLNESGRIVDVGAGTGIALEALIPLLPPGVRIDAIDISKDMIQIGKDKFPHVNWRQQHAESFLLRQSNLDGIYTAQAYQWMERERFLFAAEKALNVDGFCCIAQNNRDYATGGFVLEYERLLERFSPGYKRDYRAIDIAGELNQYFSFVQEVSVNWTQTLSVEEFVSMSKSSTQAQRALNAEGDEFENELMSLLEEYSEENTILIPYVSESYTAWKQ